MRAATRAMFALAATERVFGAAPRCKFHIEKLFTNYTDKRTMDSKNNLISTRKETP